MKRSRQTFKVKKYDQHTCWVNSAFEGFDLINFSLIINATYLSLLAKRKNMKFFKYLIQQKFFLDIYNLVWKLQVLNGFLSFKYFLKAFSPKLNFLSFNTYTVERITLFNTYTTVKKKLLSMF